MASRDPKKEYEREAGIRIGLQPDPMLHEGRSSRLWVGTVFVVIVAALIVSFIAVSGAYHNAAQTQATHRSSVTTGAGPTPSTAAAPPSHNNSNRPLKGHSGAN
jgi:cell division protein FtsN